MEKPKLSIIVPVYNMEKYLRQCLDSIKDQTFKDWECILVDDGSKDSSPEICDEYASKDPRFKVIHKINGGLSSARNAGLKECKGDLIGFVDSDDWIEPQMYQILYNLIVDYDADLALIGFIKEFKGKHSTKHLTNKTKVLTREEAIREIGFDRIPNYVWNKLQKRSIITCDFPIGRNFEDIYVYGEWLKNVRSIVIDPTPMYHYRMRKGSIIHSDVAKNRYDYFQSCIDRMNMIESSINENYDTVSRNVYMNKSAVGASKTIARLENNIIKRDDTIIKISNEVKKYPLPSPLHVKLKTWWRAKLLRNYPLFFGFLMRVVYTADLDMKRRKKKYYD
ncbi:MAG: glycosyltransferase [Muribaculaceae bacterium]|nr:glycosyltransferase [Muribaculaceae bacterium]